MLPLNDKALRAALINVSVRERNELTPPDLTAVKWDTIDYLGWRDRKIPSLGYVIVELEDGPVGLMLKQAETRPRSRAQCSWCEDVLLPNDVLFFSAKRTGKAGRAGNTVATLVCSEFECSVNVRKRPSSAYVGFDVDAAREQRIQSLSVNVRRFVTNVRDGE